MEVLCLQHQDMLAVFEDEFVGMTRNPITLAELQHTRRKLKETLPAALTPNHRQFLLGLVMGEPDWQLMKCPHLAQLPAVRWKLQNLARLKNSNPRKFAQQAEEFNARIVPDKLCKLAKYSYDHILRRMCAKVCGKIVMNSLQCFPRMYV